MGQLRTGMPRMNELFFIFSFPTWKVIHWLSSCLVLTGTWRGGFVLTYHAPRQSQICRSITHLQSMKHNIFAGVPITGIFLFPKAQFCEMWHFRDFPRAIFRCCFRDVTFPRFPKGRKFPGLPGVEEFPYPMRVSPSCELPVNFF